MNFISNKEILNKFTEFKEAFSKCANDDSESFILAVKTSRDFGVIAGGEFESMMELMIKISQQTKIQEISK